LNICERIPSSMGERTGRGDWRLVPVGEGLSRPSHSFWIFGCRGLLAFGTHRVVRVVPGRPARSGSVELGTSRVVG
jgi:hypothetical protein